MIENIYIIVDDKKKIWRDSARASRQQCINHFIKDWLSRCPMLDDFDARNVWKIFEQNGWSIQELEILREPSPEKL